MEDLRKILSNYDKAKDRNSCLEYTRPRFMPPVRRFKDRKEGKASSGLCYYHNKYGNEALKCKKQNAEGIPCPMHGEWEEKTENGALKNESQQEDTKKQRQNGQPQQEIEEKQPKKDEVVPDATMILQTRSSKEVSIAPTVKNNGEWNDELHLSEMLRRTYDPFQASGIKHRCRS